MWSPSSSEQTSIDVPLTFIRQTRLFRAKTWLCPFQISSADIFDSQNNFSRPNRVLILQVPEIPFKSFQIILQIFRIRIVQFFYRVEISFLPAQSAAQFFVNFVDFVLSMIQIIQLLGSD